MGVVVLVVLAAIWAAFLLPPILRDRQNNRPAGSIYDFRRQLHVLARSSPAGGGASGMRGVASVPYRPSVAVVGARRLSRQRTIRRRRDIMLGLLVAMGGSLVLGLLPPLRVLWVVHAVLDVLFVAYVGMLVYLRNLAAERDMKVRFLPTARASEPALLLRRSAN